MTLAALCVPDAIVLLLVFVVVPFASMGGRTLRRRFRPEPAVATPTTEVESPRIAA